VTELPAQALPSSGTPTLAEVYAAHASTVMRWATRLLRHPQDAADVTQEVFLVVQRRLPDFTAREAKLETWLFRITENLVRARRRRERLTEWLFSPPEAMPDVASPTASPEQALAQQADAQLVARALAKLGDTDRALLVLFELEGYPGAEVAEMLSLSPSVIWVRLSRARARFLAVLHQLSPQEAP
jgi:RNA polymerase sigma-70 factor (ECF subfamily)